jgi:hypothetical protein
VETRALETGRTLPGDLTRLLVALVAKKDLAAPVCPPAGVLAFFARKGDRHDV